MNCLKYILYMTLSAGMAVPAAGANPPGKEKAAAESTAASTGHAAEKTVNLGYFDIPADALTGAVSVAYGYQMAKTPEASMPKTLNGLLPGLTIRENSHIPSEGASSTENPGVQMWIRGLSTVNGTTPMVIVDGVLCPGTNYVYFTPEEIESVTLLKDAATLSLYGIQGANGVIAIKTKRGSEGKPRVVVTLDQAFQKMTRHPRIFNSLEYAALRNEAGFNDGLGRFSQFSQWDIEQYKAMDSEGYADNNWYDMFHDDLQLMTRAGIAVSGGNKRARYFTSVNYLHQTSSFKTEENEKYNPEPKSDWFNFRTNLDLDFNSYLTGFLSLAGNIRNDKTTGFSNSDIYASLFSLPPTLYGPVTPTDDFGENGGQVVVTQNCTNTPYGMLNRSGYIHNLTVNVMAQAGIGVDLGFLTKGLSLNARMAYQTNSFNQTATTQDFERWIRTNDRNTLQFIKHGTSLNSNLVYGKSSTMDWNLNLSGQLSYRRTFGDHYVDAFAYIMYQNQELQKSAFQYKRESMGVTATYGFRNRYFIRGDIGCSGSDQFHKDHRYIATPAVSAAWIASRESFLRDLTWLDNLKLRASYGITANDQFGNDRMLYVDYLDVNGNEGLMGNPALTAEKMTKQNYGVDLGLFQGLDISFDWYRSKSDNMLVGSANAIPTFQGVPLGNYPRTNTGKMENHGYEISALYSRNITRDLNITVGGSFSYNRNKVISVNESPQPVDAAYRLRSEGYSYGTPWGYLVDYSNGNGFFNFPEEITASGLSYSFGTPRVGDLIYQDLNGDKVIDEKDMAPIGYSTIPRQSYSITLGASWKGIEVSLLMQGVGQASTVVGGTGIYENAFDGVFNDIHEHAWTQERWNNGEEITYPALSLNRSTNHVASDFFCWDASFFRIKNLEVAYTLPKVVSDKIKAEAIRISFQGHNLATWDKMKSKHIDPEVGSLTAFQPFRVYNIGLKLTF